MVPISSPVFSCACGTMTDADLAATIDAAWEDRERLSASTSGAYRDAVEAALDGLDGGKLRVVEKTADGWQVRQWLKKAVLLSFRLNDMVEIPGGPTDTERGASRWWDKVPSKFAGWSSNRFRDAGFRAVPPNGGTRCRPNSPAGRRTGFAPPGFAPCRGRSCAIPPLLRRTSC